jgi:hypothetical protein
MPALIPKEVKNTETERDIHNGHYALVQLQHQ